MTHYLVLTAGDADYALPCSAVSQLIDDGERAAIVETGRVRVRVGGFSACRLTHIDNVLPLPALLGHSLISGIAFPETGPPLFIIDPSTLSDATPLPFSIGEL